MQKVIVAFLLCLILTPSFGQVRKKITTYLLTQLNTTLSDNTKGNNPWGVGLGLQTFFNNKTKFSPCIELTGDIYLADDKVLRTDNSGTPFNDVRSMVNLFAGSSYHPAKNLSVSVVVGPSFISGQTLFGIKPSLAVYLPASPRWTATISYIHIFNRGNIIKKDFSSLSVAVGLRLF